MMSKQGSGKRPLQERNFEIVMNLITIKEDQLPQVSQQSMAALNNVLGHHIKSTQEPSTTRLAMTMYTSLWCLRLPKSREL